MSGRLQALSAARGELGSGRRCRLPAGRALQLAGEVLAVAAGLKPALLYDCGAAGPAQWRRYLSRLREAGLLRAPLHVLGLGGSVLVLHPRLAQSRVRAALCAHPAPFVDVSAARRNPALCGQQEAEAIRGHLAALLGHLRATCPVSDGPASSRRAPCSPMASCSVPSIPASSNPSSSNPSSSIPASSNPSSSNPSSSIPASSIPASSIPSSSIPMPSNNSNDTSSNPASSFPASSNCTSSISVSSNCVSSISAFSNPTPSNDVSSNPTFSIPTSSNPVLSNTTSSSPVSSHCMSSSPMPSNAVSSSPVSSSSAPSCPTSSNPASSSPVSSSEVVPTDWNLCTVVGVLLGYPAAYTFTTEEGGENCLAMTPLRVFTVRAACPRIKDGLVVQIYSFSIPESLCSELKEVLDAWCEELKGAFRAQNDFVDLRISSEVVCLPAVAL